MVSISVKLRRIRVTAFSGRDYGIDLSITLARGDTEMSLTRHTVIDYPDMTTEHILSDIKKAARNIKIELNDRPLEPSSIKVVIEDEDATKQAIISFLKELDARIQQLKAKKIVDGYVSLVNAITATKLDMP